MAGCGAYAEALYPIPPALEPSEPVPALAPHAASNGLSAQKPSLSVINSNDEFGRPAPRAQAGLPARTAAIALAPGDRGRVARPRWYVSLGALIAACWSRIRKPTRAASGDRGIAWAGSAVAARHRPVRGGYRIHRMAWRLARMTPSWPPQRIRIVSLCILILLGGAAAAQAPPKSESQDHLIADQEPIAPIPPPPAADPRKLALGERLFSDLASVRGWKPQLFLLPRHSQQRRRPQ